MDLINIIRENQLIYLDLDSLAQQLSYITGDAPLDIKNELNSMFHSGELFLDERGKISISADRGFFKARLIVNKKGYGFAVVQGLPDFFIPYHEINGAMDGDQCLVDITKKHGDEIEGKVVRVLSRKTNRIVGTYIVGTSKNIVLPDDERYPQIRIQKNDAGKAQHNQKVWVEIDRDNADKSNLRGRIVEILGVVNSPKAEQLSIIRAYNLNDNFLPETLSEAKSIVQNISPKDYPDREDFTTHRIITIDGEDAKDLDDAIEVEHVADGYILSVHIADVSHYVKENSALDKEAFKRGTSVYFPNQVIPMLPKELSNGICSLTSGENRLVLSVIIELDKNCNVKNSSIKETVIKSSHKMTYTEIKAILEGDELLIEKYKDVYQDILDFQLISNKLGDLRLQRGEIRMNLPEPFILENENGEIISIEQRIQDESHRIIESLMVLCNECVAKKYFELGAPFIYRAHEKPDDEKIKRLSTILKNLKISNELDIGENGKMPMTYQKVIDKITGDPKERTITKLILRTMMKAKYSPACIGHFGLASEYYCHFTSPIRRYPDLIIHRIIKAHLDGATKDDLKLRFANFVPQASEQSSITEKNAEECEREMDDYKKTVYMSKFIGETFVGTISGVQEFGIFVELDNGIEGLVRTEFLPIDNYTYDEGSMTIRGKYHNYTIGDTVKVIVAGANIKYRQIDFDLAGSENMRSLSSSVTQDDKNSSSAISIRKSTVQNPSKTNAKFQSVKKGKSYSAGGSGRKQKNSKSNFSNRKQKRR